MRFISGTEDCKAIRKVGFQFELIKIAFFNYTIYMKIKNVIYFLIIIIAIFISIGLFGLLVELESDHGERLTIKDVC